jgi:hypothetical protein
MNSGCRRALVGQAITVSASDRHSPAASWPSRHIAVAPKLVSMWAHITLEASALSPATLPLSYR